GAHLAPFQAVAGDWLRLSHAPMLAEIINIENFVRKT
ncbi:MAG: hypothetical protein QOF66_2454, partial [Mycobacterium sp.]|nr:hypothetical protein [Mycobacterium sp.]